MRAAAWVVSGVCGAVLAAACTSEPLCGGSAHDEGCGSAGSGGGAGDSGSGGSSGSSGSGGDSGSSGNSGSGGTGGTDETSEVLHLQELNFEFLEDAGDGWQVLVQADWELAPKSEAYGCAYFTVPEAVSLLRFKPISPPGSHHATLGVHETAAYEDGVAPCGTNTTGDRRLLGSGVGTTESDPFPEGVAMELKAGNQLVLNLHLFNVTDEPLSGTSGMLVKLGEPADEGMRASTMLAGPISFALPRGESVQTGSCTLPSDLTVFGVGPHMHQLGTHLKATAVRAGHADDVLFDGDYDFDMQVGHAIEPLTFAAGDRIEVECTYDNPTNRTVTFGDSTLDEMCFLSMAFFPASAFPGTLPCFR